MATKITKPTRNAVVAMKLQGVSPTQIESITRVSLRDQARVWAEFRRKYITAASNAIEIEGGVVTIAGEQA
jgi:hypothetical protein